MKTAEAIYNKQIVFLTNEAEHRAFKLQCVKEGLEMAPVLRQFIRDYGNKDKKK